MNRLGDSIVAAKRAIVLDPNYADRNTSLAFSFGQIEEAEWAADELLAVLPNFTLAQEMENAL